MTIPVSEAQGFSMEHGRACGPHEETKIIFVVAPAKAAGHVTHNEAGCPLLRLHAGQAPRELLVWARLQESASSLD